MINHLKDQINVIQKNLNTVSQENQFLKTKIITNEVSFLFRYLCR